MVPNCFRPNWAFGFSSLLLISQLEMWYLFTRCYIAAIPFDCIQLLDERNSYFHLPVMPALYDNVNAIHVASYNCSPVVTVWCFSGNARLEPGKLIKKLELLLFRLIWEHLAWQLNKNKGLIHLKMNLLNIWCAPFTSHWFQTRLSLFWNYLKSLGDFFV